MFKSCTLVIALTSFTEALTVASPVDPKIQAANEKLAAETTQNAATVMVGLGTEMVSLAAVPASQWANSKNYNKEAPVTMAEVCEVEKVVNHCLQEQVTLALSDLKSASTFEVLLTNVYFDTGNPTGKPQKDNVGHLLQAVTNTGHGLVENLIGWLHKSHQPGKGQNNAFSTRALGFGDYAHTYYGGAYNVATGITGQLRIANGKMAALLGKAYTPSTCLEDVPKMCSSDVEAV